MNPCQALVLCLAALAAAPLTAGDLAGSCVTGHRTGATLLFPYFEVDLDDPEGRTTLIAIHNASSEPALAHAVLWTNWGLPTLTFDLYLPGLGVETLGLRDVMQGRVPDTGLFPGAGEKLSPPPLNPHFPGCADPISNPELTAGEIADLQAKHTGRPSPTDGLCSGASTGDPSLATGYLTVDSVSDCSTTLRLPRDDGYFVEGGLGLADNRNVLWGDFFLVDPGEDFAQGLDAVALVADADRFGVGPGQRNTFYRRHTGGRDERAPLSTAVRARYLLGGGFDGGTDLLVWSEWSFSDTLPVPCGESPTGASTTIFRAELRELGGGLLDSREMVSAARSLRLPVDGEDLSAEGFGTIEMSGILIHPGGIGVPLPDEPLQTWMAAVISAEGRFSVGTPAVRMDDLCD